VRAEQEPPAAVLAEQSDGAGLGEREGQLIRTIKKNVINDTKPILK
jgi:hypothetical protein